MIFIILYKAINGQNLSENVLALAIYLLEMAVVTVQPPEETENKVTFGFP